MLTRSLPLAGALTVLAVLRADSTEPGATNVSSRITAVTVYSDRAMVTREARASVAPGSRTISLGGLPASLQDQSVRVAVTGNAQAKLLEVKVSTAFLDTVSEERLAPLLQKQKALNGEIRIVNDRAAVVARQKEFLGKISIASQESIAHDLKVQKPTTEDWVKVLSFFDTQLTKLDAEQRSLDERRLSLQEKLAAVDQEIGAAGGRPKKIEKAILVSFDVRTAGTLRLETTYLITPASWTPAYDIRVSSADTMVELAYLANVRQNTGEEWENVQMTLSTSQPSVGGYPPELQPWYVHVEEVHAAGAVMINEERAAKSAPAAPRAMNRAAAADMMIEARTAEVKESLTAASFLIGGATTVPTDNSDHRVTVMNASLGGTFSHTVVPRLQQDAFSRVALKNTTGYPLLPAPMSVYVDNGFVSTSRLPGVMPGEKFDAYLGVDRGIRIERKLLNRLTEISGLFSKTRKTSYDILITAENRKTTPQEITIKENFPVSQDERIKVVITQPRPEEVKPDPQGIASWQIRLAPGEKKEIRLQYSIEAPADLPVGGIE